MSRKQSSASSEQLAIGWISIAELFLIIGAAMLAIAGTLSGKFARADSRAEKLNNEHKTVSAENDSLATKLNKTRSELTAAQSAHQQALADKQAANDKLQDTVKAAAKITADLTAARAIATQWEMDVQRLGAEKAVLELDRNRLMTLAEGLQGRLKKADLDRQMQEMQIASVRKELERYQMKYVELEKLYGDKVKEFTDAIADLNERILKPLKAAKLIVRLRCKSLPEHLDLDLYVQDPDDHLCYWMKPRVQTAFAERATLIPSEDLRVHGSGVEEIYYSSEPLVKGKAKPYLVFCMLRDTTSGAAPVAGAPPPSATNVEVEWEIEIKQAVGPSIVHKGQQAITTVGRVVFEKEQYIYPGLEPIFGFEVPRADTSDLQFVVKADLPSYPRGWGTKSPTDAAQTVIKLRDRE